VLVDPPLAETDDVEHAADAVLTSRNTVSMYKRNFG
jgi:hypothetical protein